MISVLACGTRSADVWAYLGSSFFPVMVKVAVCAGADVPGVAGAADGDGVFARENDAVALLIDLGDGARVDCEAHMGGRAGVEVDAREAGQLVNGRLVAARLCEIHLDDFIARDRAGVPDVGFNLERLTGARFRAPFSRCCIRTWRS